VVQARARRVIPWAALAFAVLFAAAGLWLSQLEGYRIAGAIAHDGPSNPMIKTATHGPGSWFAASIAGAWLWIPVALAYAGAAGALLLRSRPGLAFVSSALVPAGTIATAGVALFPFLLPSSSEPGASLTVWDASSSRLTLGIMLGSVVIFLPIVIAYTSFVYRVMRGPVRASDIARDSHSAY
jgi:cytochrome d ubiquinol oxidase subunit II